jgi:hypothetical protein
MSNPIWTIGGRYCGRVVDNQVYDESGHHINEAYRKRKSTNQK